jgi:hypothetical protein
MPNTIGAAGLVIGCTDTAYGYVTDISISKPATEVLVKNGAGQTKGAAHTPEPWEASITYTVFSESGAAHLQVGTGTPMTFSDTDLSGKNWYVTNAEMTKSNEAYKVWAITMKYFPNF